MMKMENKPMNERRWATFPVDPTRPLAPQLKKAMDEWDGLLPSVVSKNFRLAAQIRKADAVNTTDSQARSAYAERGITTA